MIWIIHSEDVVNEQSNLMFRLLCWMLGNWLIFPHNLQKNPLSSTGTHTLTPQNQHNKKLNFSCQIQGPWIFDIKSTTVCLLVASRLTCSNSNWSESTVSEGLGRMLSLCFYSIVIRSNCPITKQKLRRINYSYVAVLSDYINRVMFV